MSDDREPEGTLRKLSAEDLQATLARPGLPESYLARFAAVRAPEPGHGEFRCAACGGIFPELPGDTEAALAEQLANGIPADEPVVAVCDDCYAAALPRIRANYPGPPAS